jgi:hypothetical protein
MSLSSLMEHQCERAAGVADPVWQHYGGRRKRDPCESFHGRGRGSAEDRLDCRWSAEAGLAALVEAARYLPVRDNTVPTHKPSRLFMVWMGQPVERLVPGNRRTSRAEIRSAAKIHSNIIGTTHAACDQLLNQIAPKSATVISIAEMKKARSRLAQANVLQRLNKTAKNGRIVIAVVISRAPDHRKRALQFMDGAVIASIGKIRPQGTHQIKAVPAAAKQISAEGSLHWRAEPTRIATRA